MYQQNTAIEIYSHQDMAFELPPPLRAAAAASSCRRRSIISMEELGLCSKHVVGQPAADR